MRVSWNWIGLPDIRFHHSSIHRIPWTSEEAGLIVCLGRSLAISVFSFRFPNLSMCCRLYHRLIYVGWSHLHIVRRHRASADMGRKWNFAVPHKFNFFPSPISSPKSCDVPTSVCISSISEAGSYRDCRFLWWNNQIISYSEPRINQPQQNLLMNFCHSHLLFPSLLSSFFLSGSFIFLES
jgi:hypothetical protein